MDFQVIHNDCTDAMRELIAQGVQVDSIVTDPPYGIRFMGMAWDGKDIEEMAEACKKRKQRLLMNGKERTIPMKMDALAAGSYDLTPKGMNAFQLWTNEWASLAFQLLKPGGHILCFASARTYHRMASGIEDAGFEIRDQLMWVFGQGFPKSLDISKAIEKMAGAERGRYNRPAFGSTYSDDNGATYGTAISNMPITDAAKQWQGWGSALKPAHEPIVLARKPLSEKTIAANVLKHGAGGINVDGCRVDYVSDSDKESATPQGIVTSKQAKDGLAKAVGIGSERIEFKRPELKGRFPANLIHDGSDEVEEEFAKYGITKSNDPGVTHVKAEGWGHSAERRNKGYQGDTGTPSRFYYCAKASKKDRAGSKHPTVKPISLMRYLCRLITPPNGTVLDPFAGSGTTGQAAIEEGFKVILIEKEAEYIADIENRLCKEKK